MNSISRRSAVLGVAVLSASLALTGCTKAATGAAPAGTGAATAAGKLTVVFIPKNLGNPYFDTSDAGGKKAVEALGGTYSEVGPQTGSPDGQVQYINTAAQ
jgi:rhamnose transport system substrate-binding protein